MIVKELHRSVRYEIDKTDSLDSVGFLPEEYDYWLNAAIINIVKSKFSGSGVKREAFEQTQKRIDDLRTLVVKENIDTEKHNDDSSDVIVYKASLPSPSYWFTVGESVYIVIKTGNESIDSGDLKVGSWYKVEKDSITHEGTDYDSGDYFKAESDGYNGDGKVYECVEKKQGITETTLDRYQFDVSNPYNEFNLHNKEAKPLRLFRGDDVYLTTDGNYHISKYELVYIKEPQKVSIDTVTEIEEDVLYDVSDSSIDYNGKTYNPGDTFIGVEGEDSFSGTGEVRKTTDLPIHTHDEIVKRTANMMLENTENPRYQTHSVENIKSE